MTGPLRVFRQSSLKLWPAHSDQVARLVARILTVTDANAAEYFLSHLSDYRFNGDCIAFEQPQHSCPNDVTLKQIRFARKFDMELRDRVTEAFETV